MVASPQGAMSPRRQSYNNLLVACAEATPPRVSDVAAVVSGMLNKKVELTKQVGAVVLACLQRAAPAHAAVAARVIAAIRGGGGGQQQQAGTVFPPPQLPSSGAGVAGVSANANGAGAKAGGRVSNPKLKMKSKDAGTFSVLLAECLGKGDMATAVELLDEMVAEELAPDSATYNTLINACLVRTPSPLILLALMNAWLVRTPPFLLCTLIAALLVSLPLPPSPRKHMPDHVLSASSTP
jgi:pentatricopeptide repeat protein